MTVAGHNRVVVASSAINETSFTVGRDGPGAVDAVGQFQAANWLAESMRASALMAVRITSRAKDFACGSPRRAVGRLNFKGSGFTRCVTHHILSVWAGRVSPRAGLSFVGPSTSAARAQPVDQRSPRHRRDRDALGLGRVVKQPRHLGREPHAEKLREHQLASASDTSLKNRGAQPTPRTRMFSALAGAPFRPWQLRAAGGLARAAELLVILRLRVTRGNAPTIPSLQPREDLRPRQASVRQLEPQ